MNHKWQQVNHMFISEWGQIFEQTELTSNMGENDENSGIGFIHKCALNIRIRIEYFDTSFNTKHQRQHIHILTFSMFEPPFATSAVNMKPMPLFWTFSPLFDVCSILCFEDFFPGTQARYKHKRTHFMRTIHHRSKIQP